MENCNFSIPDMLGGGANPGTGFELMLFICYFHF